MLICAYIYIFFDTSRILKGEEEKQTVKNEKAKLDPLKFGIACSVAWALLIVSTAFGAMFVNLGGEPWGGEFVRVFGSLYAGFGPSLEGAFFGLLWGLFDGFLAGFIIASIYNHLNRS